MHGWGGSKDSFACIASRISHLHDCICVDFPGFGSEPAPKEAFGVEDYARWLKDKLESLSITGKVTLVGHSFGGRVAIMFANKYADFVEKLVLVDSAGIKPKLKINKVIKVILFRFYKKCAKIGLCSKKHLTRFGSTDWKNLPENMKGTFVKVIKQDLSSFAKTISVQALICWGEKDMDTPLYMARKLHKLIEKSRLIIFKNSGHFSYLENVEEFSSLLINFLS